MTDVWFIGTGDRVITAADWANAGVAGSYVSWNASNGWSLPTALFSVDQLDILDTDSNFLLGQSGPRAVPTPGPTDLAGNNSYAYYLAAKEKFDESTDLFGRRPISASYRPLTEGNPDVTASVVASSSLTGIAFTAYNANAGKFRYVGCTMIDKTGGGFGLNDNNTYAQTGSTLPIVVEFWSNATTVTVLLNTYAQRDCWAVVDDRRVNFAGNAWQVAHFPLGSGYMQYKLTSSGSVWRKYRISTSPEFVGVGVNTGATMVPTNPGFQLGIMGDSLIGWAIQIDNAVSPGTYGTISSGSVTGELQQYTGLDIWEAGIGSSGYFAQAGRGSDGVYGSPRRIGAFAAMPPLDAVLFWGTLNDGVGSYNQVVSAAQAAWTAMKIAQPSAAILVAGVEDIELTPNPYMDGMNDALKAAAEAHPDVEAFIDIRTKPFIFGSGKDGTPTGDGNSDIMRASDGLHVTHSGARHTAYNFARKLGAVTIPLVSGGSL